MRTVSRGVVSYGKLRLEILNGYETFGEQFSRIQCGGRHGIFSCCKRCVQTLAVPMNPVLRARLQREFRPEVEKLSELIGRDLTFWCDSKP